MRIRTWMAAAAALPIAAMSIAAAPAGGTDCHTSDTNPEAEVCRTRTWLQCETTVPFYNNWLLDGTAQFTIDDPGGSFANGDGCGEYDEPAFRNTTQDGIYSWDMAGWVEGNLDAMTVELHNLGFTDERAGGDITLSVRVAIDGASPMGSETVENVSGDPFQTPRFFDVTVTPQASENGVTNVYRFTIDGLGKFLDTLEPGQVDTERFVQISIDNPGPVGFNPWIWGTSDAGTGVIFNPIEGDDLGTVVEATG